MSADCFAERGGVGAGEYDDEKTRPDEIRISPA